MGASFLLPVRRGAAALRELGREGERRRKGSHGEQPSQATSSR